MSAANGSSRAGAVTAVKRQIVRAAQAGAERFGYRLTRRDASAVRADGYPHDFDDALVATCEAVAPYTLTTPERIAGLVHAVRHLAAHGIAGDVVECGVWRGGSMLAVARTLLECGDADRDLWLYDTFTRMPPPGERDYDIWGRHASAYFEGPVDPHDTDGYRYLPLEEVRAVLEGSGYPAERLRFVPGLVEETIPAQAPERIALLRLDTDWYESTRHELEHLFPRIVDGGILIIDDYGQFTGARAAVDEHLATLDRPLFLSRLDWTGRLAVIHH